MSYVLGLDATVLGDGGVSSGAVSGGLCDLDSVSRGDVVGVLMRCRCQEVVMQLCRVLTSLCVV